MARLPSAAIPSRPSTKKPVCRSTLGLELGPVTWVPEPAHHQVVTGGLKPRVDGGRVWQQVERSAPMGLMLTFVMCWDHVVGAVAN